MFIYWCVIISRFESGFIGWRWTLAGLALEDDKKREAVLNMVKECRQLAGWPVQPLEDELTLAWKKTDQAWHSCVTKGCTTSNFINNMLFYLYSPCHQDPARGPNGCRLVQKLLSTVGGSLHLQSIEKGDCTWKNEIIKREQALHSTNQARNMFDVISYGRYDTVLPCSAFCEILTVRLLVGRFISVVNFFQSLKEHQ
jgi:hypothetical protein